MAPSFSNRIKHAWNAFTNDKVSRNMTYLDTGGSYVTSINQRKHLNKT